MNSNRVCIVAAAASLLACSGAVVQAGAEARQFGVHSYEVEGSAVSLLAADGSLRGVLRVSGGGDARQVTIEYPDLVQYTNEVSRPVRGFFRAPVLATREGFIQADPALASFFAAHALQFKVEKQSAPHPMPVAECRDIVWSGGCEQCPENSAHACTYSEIDGGLVAHGHAHCPPIDHGCAFEDLVSKDRTCYAGASCTQHALGFFACSEPAPDYCGRRGDD